MTHAVERPQHGFALLAAGQAPVSSCASEEDISRYAFAWASNSLAFFSKVSTASAPAAQRIGGSAWLASWTRALASLAGSPPCKPFIPFQAVMVCLVFSA